MVGGALFGWLTAPTVYAQKRLPAATPLLIVLGAEILLIGAWLIYFA